MKFKGRKIEKPNVVYVVVPRSSGEDMVFQATAVLDMEVYVKKFPAPEPPVRFLKGNVRERATNDPSYIEAMSKWAEAQANWMYLTSLEGTEGLEWETVDMQDPATFANWQKELHDAHFTVAEIGRIMNGVHEACGLSQERIDEARDRFLAGLLEEQDRLSSQGTARLITLSGEPVNVGESVQKE